MKAAKEGDVEKVERLLKEGAKVSAQNEHGWSALHHAVWFDREEVIERLIEAGADPEAIGKNGISEMRRCQQEGWTKAVGWLRGAKAIMEREELRKESRSGQDKKGMPRL